MKAFGSEGLPYALFAFVGILCWSFFSTALGNGGKSLAHQQGAAGQDPVPRECFPLETMCVSAVNTVLSWIPLALLFVIFGRAPSSTTVWVPCSCVIEVVFAAGVSLAVSSIIIQMRDLMQVLPIITSLGLFVTPVIWPFSEIPTSYHIAGGMRVTTIGPNGHRRITPLGRVGSRINLQIVYGFFNPLGPVIDSAPTDHAPRPVPRIAPDRAAAAIGAMLLPAGRLPDLQAARGELCRHCLTATHPGRARLEEVPRRPDGPQVLRPDEAVREVDRNAEPARLPLGAEGRQPGGAPGGTLALIGINGSGKTTLLKIISQVTYQSAGRCEVQGRIGALLSVTSGIHPELTGRENIYLYGTVMGMGRQKIRSGSTRSSSSPGWPMRSTARSSSTPSGMQMRLGFSIAAYLEPDILLVDEVLAVGDANFQQKCLQRIGEVVRTGTTLLYVSHDLASVEASCERAIWLADAVVQAAGQPGRWWPSTAPRWSRTPP